MGHVEVDRERCKGCERCLAVCPRQLLALAPEINRLGYHPARFDGAERCTACALCGLVCPEAALAIYRDAGRG